MGYKPTGEYGAAFKAWLDANGGSKVYHAPLGGEKQKAREAALREEWMTTTPEGRAYAAGGGANDDKGLYKKEYSGLDSFLNKVMPALPYVAAAGVGAGVLAPYLAPAAATTTGGAGTVGAGTVLLPEASTIGASTIPGWVDGTLPVIAGSTAGQTAASSWLKNPQVVNAASQGVNALLQSTNKPQQTEPRYRRRRIQRPDGTVFDYYQLIDKGGEMYNQPNVWSILGSTIGGAGSAYATGQVTDQRDALAHERAKELAKIKTDRDSLSTLV